VAAKKAREFTMQKRTIFDHPGMAACLLLRSGRAVTDGRGETVWG
jgi:hypothetical protein